MLSFFKKCSAPLLDSCYKSPLFCETKPKSYVGVNEFVPLVGCDLDPLFKGDEDELFSATDTDKDILKPSWFFRINCKIFPTLDLEKAVKVMIHRGTTRESVYILAMDCDPDQVKMIAAKGEFSHHVIKAINVNDYRNYYYSSDPEDKEKIEIVVNPYYNTSNRHTCCLQQ